jgi:phosphatidylserine/phosphatidylglycerophosphate/cardiolipin synthase-like enzyme
MEALLSLPPHLRERLAGALDNALVVPPYTQPALRAALGVPGELGPVAEALDNLARLGIAGPGAAAWIRTVDQVAADRRAPDLVWSGPGVPGTSARRTAAVFEELVSSAERSIWASTYAFFDGPRAFDSLARRMDALPLLQVVLLLNIQRGRGDPAPADHLVRRFADRFWAEEWPGATRPQVFYDPRSLEPDRPAGVLHAKAVVSDEEAVLVSSANFTEAARERNIELGLLVRDRPLAASITRHFRALIDHRILRALPPT